MCARRVDLVSKRILQAVSEHPRANPAMLAAELGLSEEVFSTRLRRLEEDGIITGYGTRIDANKVGLPHEVMVFGTPSGETTKESLSRLGNAPGVTRVFTLASRQSVVFTYRGPDHAKIEQNAINLATEAGLIEVDVTLVVNTLHDDAGRGVGRVLLTAN